MKKIGIGFGIVMALVLIVQTVGFFAVKWKWTNVAGAVDLHNDAFRQVARRVKEIPVQKKQIDVVQCKIDALGSHARYNTEMIGNAYRQTDSKALAEFMIEAVVLRLEDEGKPIRSILAQCESGGMPHGAAGDLETVFPWMQTEDWVVFRDAIVKDELIIERVAREADVEPRLIVTQLVAEQLRLFNSSREVYKRFFAPLRMLGNETKFSWGVTGVKEETAIRIEENLKNRQSSFWLGEQYEHLLDFDSDEDVEEARFKRITAKDHYYAYLYAALYVRQVTRQWEVAGYDISHRPDILATLYNIGFDRSKPKPDPAVGGAMITIVDRKYSFGSIGYEFYFSGELMDQFPYTMWQ